VIRRCPVWDSGGFICAIGVGMQAEVPAEKRAVHGGAPVASWAEGRCKKGTHFQTLFRFCGTSAKSFSESKAISIAGRNFQAFFTGVIPKRALQTDEFPKNYAARAGIEGTHAQAIIQHSEEPRAKEKASSGG
jgi:hypothetical protein